MAYILSEYAGNDAAEDFWRTPHYPFHAMKRGTKMLIDFIDGLEFGDKLGIVSYAGSGSSTSTLTNTGFSRTESTIDGTATITDEYTVLQDCHWPKMAGHYSSRTGMGFGIYRARNLLASAGREGAQKMMVVLTDGMANAHWTGYSAISDAEVQQMTSGYNGAGTSLTVSAGDDGTIDGKKFALRESQNTIEGGVVIHTMTVGEDGDTDLMKAIAYAGNGVYYHVPGITASTLSEDVIADMQEVFAQIASNVPAARLLHQDAGGEE
jgi:hypothetical protein